VALEVGGSSPLGHPNPHCQFWFSKSYTLPMSLWFSRSLLSDADVQGLRPTGTHRGARHAWWYPRSAPPVHRDGLRPPTAILPLDTSQVTDSNTASREV
jgi:hypothetical protein